LSGKLQAVLDIGSNTIRLLIAEVQASGSFNRIHYQHSIARLGEGLQQTSKLSEQGMCRAISAFQGMVAVCQSHHIEADEIRAVATAAVREAHNGQAFIDRAYAESGLMVRVISGEEEAGLALKGAMFGLPPHIGQDMLLFDIGGGSTEFSRVADGQLQDAISLKMGVVRFAEKHLNTDPPSTENYAQMKAWANCFIDDLTSFWGESAGLPKYLVGTAGSVTTLAAIAQEIQCYDAAAINGYHLSYGAFVDLRDQLLCQCNAERLMNPALEQGREDVIIAGLAMIDVMFERWGYNVLVSVDSGLLEGLLGVGEDWVGS